MHADWQSRSIVMKAVSVNSESHAGGSQDYDILERVAQHTLAANPLVGVRGYDILSSALILVTQLVNNPTIAARQYLFFLGEFGRIATGGFVLTPQPRGKRFAAPGWKERVAYPALAQCHLARGAAPYRVVAVGKMGNA